MHCSRRSPRPAPRTVRGCEDDLAKYGWAGSLTAFLDTVAARIQAHVTGLHALAARDPLFAQIVAHGGADDLQTALAELNHFT